MILKGKPTKYIIAIVVVLVVGAVLAVAGTRLRTAPQEVIQQVEQPTSKINRQISTSLEVDDLILEDWKTYTNDEFGFSFQYPSTWSKYDKDGHATNLSGDLLRVMVDFNDTATNSNLLVSYYPPPKGYERYEYAVSQYKSAQGWYALGANEIEVAGNKAIEVSTVVTEDEDFYPPVKLIIVSFLDKQNTGAFKLVLQTPLLDNNSEVVYKFNQLLSSFKFNS